MKADEKWEKLYEQLNIWKSHDVLYSDDIPQSVLDDVVYFMNSLDNQ